MIVDVARKSRNTRLPLRFAPKWTKLGDKLKPNPYSRNPWYRKWGQVGRAAGVEVGSVGMAHEIAKLLLEHCGTALEREAAIDTALSMGMTLQEIEEYLDWLDIMKTPPHNDRRS